MNGHEQILSLRRSGFKPAFVWLQDSGLLPTDNAVTLAKTDIPEALDLRFLVGTTVLAESDDLARLERMTAACQVAKAQRVIGNLHSLQNGRFEVLKTTDTEGVMAWPK